MVKGREEERKEIWEREGEERNLVESKTNEGVFVREIYIYIYIYI